MAMISHSILVSASGIKLNIESLIISQTTFNSLAQLMTSVLETYTADAHT